MLVSEILEIKGTVLYTVVPSSPLGEAVATMTEQDIGSLVVFDAGQMVGMLTFREVLRAVHHAGAGWMECTVGEAMLAEPQVTHPDMEMSELRKQMVEHHQRYIPVMDGKVLLGVVSFHDVAKGELEEQSFENRMLKNYIKHWPEQDDSA